MPTPSHYLLISFITLVLPSVFALPIFPSSTVYCMPTTWMDIFSFFLLNYVAHAATTPSPPGVKTWGTIQFPILSVLFPFLGLGRAAFIILSDAWYGEDDLGKALSVGALAVVARTSAWKPLTQGDTKLLCHAMPIGFLEDSGTSKPGPLRSEGSRRYDLQCSPCRTRFNSNIRPTAAIIVNKSWGTLEAGEGDHIIHGNHALPEGYKWIIPPQRLCYRLVKGLKGRSETKIARSRSMLKVTISLIQLILSCTTIYRTRGPQIDRYGYAAFGLSTIPYAFMSLLNLICVGCTGEYPCLYMLRTHTIEEANRREGADIVGAVGSLPTAHSSRNKSAQDSAPERERLLKNEKKGGAQDASLWMEDNKKTLCVKVGNSTRKLQLVDAPENASFLFEVDDLENRLDIHEAGARRLFSYSTQPGLRRFKKVSRWYRFKLVLKICVAILSPVFALFLPYIIIFVLTRFHKQQSTGLERVVMMTWMAVGQLPVLFGIWFFLSPNYIFPSPSRFRRRRSPEPVKHMRRPRRSPSLLTSMNVLGTMDWWSRLNTVFGLPIFGLCAAALSLLICFPLAGFMMVGKMLYEADTCSLA